MTKKTIVQELSDIYANFCVSHPKLTFKKVVQTTSDSYLVIIESDNSFPSTKDHNSQKQNIRITKRWTRLVKLPRVVDLLTTDDLYIVSVQQIDIAGKKHSMAII